MRMCERDVLILIILPDLLKEEINTIKIIMIGQSITDKLVHQMAIMTGYILRIFFTDNKKKSISHHI